MTSPRKRLVQTAIFAALWLAGLELLTRTFLVSPTNIVPDPAVGYLYAPNSTALIETADAGFKRASFNELGFNDGPLGRNDPRPRILVLGDSYVEAFQVPRGQNFMGRLGTARPDLHFVNGGRSGLDPVTEFAMFEKLAPVVHPAGVILVVNSGDAADLLADGLKVKRCGPEICGYSMGPIAQPNRTGLAGVISRSSGLLTYVVRRFEAPVRAGLPRIADWVPRFASARASAPSADSYTAGDFGALLTFVFGRIASKYPLLVVTVPNLTFEPGGKTVVSDGGAFERITRSAAAGAGADLVDAAPILTAAYAKSGQPPRGFDFNQPGIGHLNQAGHLALAQEIERHLGILEIKVAR